MSNELHCSFCRKSEHHVQKLVAGPGVYICDACVQIAARIMERAGPPPLKAPLWRRLARRARGWFDGLRGRSLLATAGQRDVTGA
jgi:hypothetical protein